MCGISEGFKLCTCGLNSEKIDQDKPYWILLRKVPRQKDEFGCHVVGECFVGMTQNFKLREFILNELRSRNCFDQDLNLMQKDKLDIVTATETYSYELRKRGWQLVYPVISRGESREVSKGKVAL